MWRRRAPRSSAACPSWRARCATPASRSPEAASRSTPADAPAMTTTPDARRRASRAAAIPPRPRSPPIRNESCARSPLAASTSTPDTAAAPAAEEDAASAETATPGTPGAAVKGAPFYLPLDPFIVNLADREADRYAQIGITFEVENSTTGDQIKAYMPAIRNAVLMILANKTSKDLLNREGKEQLALEIQREAARPMGIEIAGPEPVTVTTASASATDVAPAAKAKPRRRGETRNPIQHVHFSSFIIQ